MTLGVARALPAHKKCGRCQTVKPAEAFARCKSRGDGLNTRCKQCCREHYLANHEAAKARMRAYHQRNREELLVKQRINWHENRDARLKAQREYQEKNKDRIRQKDREYQQRNKDRRAAYNRQYQKDNRTARSEYSKRWNAHQRRNDPLFRLKSSLRTRTNDAIRRGGYTKLSGMNEAIGCDWPTLQAHLSSYFTTSMTWENYGSCWVVDHHVPLASATTSQEVMTLCHYTNLRPLGRLENLRKGASLPEHCGADR